MTISDLNSRFVARRRRLGLAAVGIVCVTIVAGVSAVLPAGAHYADFTGSVYYDVYVPTNENRCVPAGCANHSWTFVSGDDVSNYSYPCPKLMNASYHAWYEQTCGFDFVRHCDIYREHDGGGLNCHDQDSNTNIHAGSSNGGSGTTIRIHGGY